jgi:hypothetical protein
MQKTRGRAVRKGLLGNQLFWKIVMKVGNEHGSRL